MAGTSTVTIDRSYFETLLRRAETRTSGKDLSTPLNLPVVTIPKQDHDLLLQAVQEYTVLKKALLRGGIVPETLAVLIDGGSGQASMEEQISFPPESPRGDYSRPVGKNNSRHSHQDSSSNPSKLQQILTSSNTRWRRPSEHHHNTNSNGDSYFPSEFEREESSMPVTPSYEKPHLARQEQRTVRLKNLSESVEHKDVADVVRGGQILDIYLRPIDKSGTVSFVEGHAAQGFLAYTRRNDIYIRGKRVEISWNDRHFILPGHVAGKIQLGASRNLVVRNIHTSMTEDRIREDLEHIHNLVIIEVKFVDSDAFISLNSVHNALFARTCMMSRAAYKGTRIEWYHDECAQPLPTVQYTPRQETTKSARKLDPMANRFQMLDMDDETENSVEEKSGQDEDDESVVYKGHKSGQWTSTAVVA